jgi:hypothetical protein
MGSPEEVAHGLGEITQCLLLNRVGSSGQPRECLSRLGQLARLFAVAGRTRSSRTPMKVLFHGKIPDKTGMCAVLQQRRLLYGRGLKPKPHAATLLTTTDIPRRERRRAQMSAPEDRTSQNR